MKILARYISALFLKNFLYSLAGLTLLFFFQAVMDQFLRESYPANQILFYNILSVPDVVVQMIPPSVLLSTVLTLSGMNRTNELTAAFSLGVSLNQIMGVILSLVFIISCFSLILQDRILPPFYRKKTVYYWREMKGRNDFFLDVKRAKIWYRSKNLIYNLQTFDQKSETIHGMAVYTFDPQFRLIQVVNAKMASFENQKWKLKDGVVTIFVGDDAIPMTKGFKEKELIIAEKPKDFQEIEKEVDGLRLKELYQYINKTSDTGANTTVYEVKFHYRLSLSFIPMVMGFLALPFSVRNRREGGIAKDLGFCLVVTFFYWLFYSVSLSMGKNGALYPWLAAWLPSVIFVGLTALFLTLRKKA